MTRKTMADIDIEKVESFLNIYERWIAPWLDDIKKDPEGYGGLTLVDTHTAHGRAASMISPRVLDDIEQIGMEFREISIINKDDDLVNDYDDVQVGHIKMHLRPKQIELRIKPRTDLENERIPRKYF